jgi:broad specificity phosphatase PhoE
MAGPGGASAGAEPTEPEPSFGSGTRVWLFRHAEVHEDWQGKAYGGMDVPLSERGRADTLRLGERFGGLPFRAVISSNLVRARLLGELLAERSGAPLIVSAGLAEIARGRWQGRTVADLHERSSDEVAAFYADPWHFNGHGGETDADVAARAWPVLAAALAEARGDPRQRPLAVAAHYNVLRVLVARALGIPPSRSFRLRIDLGALTVLRDDPAGWRLERLNVRELAGAHG